MKLEQPAATPEEKAFLDAFRELLKTCPKSLRWSLEEDGDWAELSIMKKTSYGACGIADPFKVRCV